MCKITKETVKKASQKTISSPIVPSTKSRGTISLSLKYRGGSYRNSISMVQVKEAYGRALAIVDKK